MAFNLERDIFILKAYFRSGHRVNGEYEYSFKQAAEEFRLQFPQAQIGDENLIQHIQEVIRLFRDTGGVIDGNTPPRPARTKSKNLASTTTKTASEDVEHLHLSFIDDFPTIDISVLCDICGKRLSCKEKLKFHMRIHTGYKPYACKTCPKAFSRRESLREHERVHTGERPFTCRFCDKGFTQRGSLRIHVRLHTGEKPYTCRFCDKGFVSKNSMDAHMKNCNGAT